jgi:hypothetical protein
VCEMVTVTQYNLYIPQRQPTEELNAIFDAYFGKIETRTESILLDLFVSFALMRAYKSFNAVDVLMSKGLHEDAASLCRGLIETLINLRWVVADETGNRLKLFADYENTRSAKLREAWKVIAPGQDIPDVLKGDEPASKSPTWSGKPIKQMAQEVGMESDYLCHYFQLCDYTHGNASTFGSYININPLLGEEACDDRWTPAPFFANCYFQQILSVAAKQLSIDVEDELQEIAHHITRAAIYEQVLMELCYVIKQCKCYSYEIIYRNYDHYDVIVKTRDGLPIVRQEFSLNIPAQCHILPADELHNAAHEFIHGLHRAAASCSAQMHTEKRD